MAVLRSRKKIKNKCSINKKTGRCRKSKISDGMCELSIQTNRCKKKSVKIPFKNIKKIGKILDKGYIDKRVKLTESQKKWCRCVLHISRNNSKECNMTKKYGKLKKCYNPYSVCTKKKLQQTGKKPCYYLFRKNIPLSEVRSYLQMNYKKYNKWATKTGNLLYNEIEKLPNKRTREKVLRKNINTWYKKK